MTDISGKIIFEREDLYKKIWKAPISQVAKEYSISDVGLAKICHKLNVPRPPVGYWAKMKFGKGGNIPPLPSVGPNDPNTHIYYPQSEVGIRDEIKRLEQNIVYPEINVSIPDSIEAPHKVVREIKASLKIPRIDDYGLLEGYSRGISLRVSAELKDRALRILETLIGGIESSGYGFKKGRDEYREFYYLCVENEGISFSLSEGTHRRDHKLTAEDRQNIRAGRSWLIKKYEYTPTGELSLKITNEILSPIHKSWSDGKRQRLENMLSDFIRGIILASYIIKIERKKEEEAKKKREEEHRRWQEEEWRLRQEQIQIEKLIKDAQQWNVYMLVRKYIKAIENGLPVLKINDKSWTDLSKWIAWAKEKTEKMNPIAKILPDLEFEGDGEE